MKFLNWLLGRHNTVPPNPERDAVAERLAAATSLWGEQKAQNDPVLDEVERVQRMIEHTGRSRGGHARAR